jgi:hypothetical protein
MTSKMADFRSNVMGKQTKNIAWQPQLCGYFHHRQERFDTQVLVWPIQFAAILPRPCG